MILAGGLGTRLYPLTINKPKALLEYKGKPLLSHLVSRIPRHIDILITINLKFESDFRQWQRGVGRDTELCIEETRSQEQKIGAVSSLDFWIKSKGIRDDLLVIAGDNYFEFDLSQFIAAYNGNNTLVAIHDIGDRSQARQFGVVQLDGHHIVELDEKPAKPKSSLVATASYILPSRVFPLLHQYCSGGKRDNLGSFISHLIATDEVHGYIFTEPWFDIGSNPGNFTLGQRGKQEVRDKLVGKEAEHWEQVARGWSVTGYSNELLAEHKRKTYLNLMARWAKLTNNKRILKTDLFAEAFVVEQFLFDIAPVSGVVGIDISAEIVKQAKRQTSQRGIDAGKYLCCDVKKLPLRDNSIDLIISDSTLDHFPSEADIITALKELGRVLRPGGILILTIDNKSNLTYPPYFIVRLWMKLGLSPYFIGRTLSLAKLRHTLEGIGLGVEESTAILHYPHPDGLVRWLEHSLRQLSRGRLNNAIRKGLDLLDRLEGKRIKYLTGRYIAVKAVKRGAA